MLNQAPASFSAKHYQWIMSAHIRITHNKYNVYFTSSTDYENLLNKPFELARIALNAGCVTIPIYVGTEISDLELPRITLNVNSVLGLGSRVGVVR
jgi:hypothetical protein